MSKELIAPLTLTLAIIAVFGLGISYEQGEFDYLFEPKPEVGQIWFPDYAPVQPYWHDIGEIEVVDIKRDFIRVKIGGSYRVHSIQEFHAKFNFARKDASLTK